MALLTLLLCLRRGVMPTAPTSRRGTLSRLWLAPLLVLTASVGFAQSWTPLKNLAPCGITVTIQATDGRILAQCLDGVGTWVALTPDSTGSYVNGSWSFLAPMPTPRLYFADQMLQNGKLFIVGGEYSGPGLPFQPNWSYTGNIYDPISNTWSTITPFPNQPNCPSFSTPPPPS